MPIAINTSRPPSATGSVSGNGAPRTTTTSRRGGRTRSRSPPVMGSRLNLGGDAASLPPSGENPSSAAAAAAAAAKAFSSGPRQSANWPEGRGGEDAFYDRRSWPAEDGRYRYPPAQYEGYPPQFERYDRRAERHHYDERGPPRGHYHDYRYRGGPIPKGVPPPHHRPGGGTSLVLGGATPIHVPKTAGSESNGVSSGSSSGHPRRESRGNSAASVFRGRPGGELKSAAAPGGDDDNSPQKILLSLRTPTTSFEDKAPDRPTNSGGTLPLSPDEPPQIQNSTQQQRASDPMFEPQRSPGGSKTTASIEAAPSFSLFNQSFDSFGDGHYFNVDASLENDSFGMGRTASVDPDSAAQILRSTSNGNISQQLLAATGSGALTIGYSPVNSFGNLSASGPRRSGNMMVVGGPDPRASSPTAQVLGMYRSYSGGGPRSGPLDDSHLRMSVGSFGAPSMAFSRSYGEPGPSPNYYYGGPGRPHEGSDKNPPFYSFLKRYRAAFKNCTFLLPGLKAALLETPLPESGEQSRPNPTSSDSGPMNGPAWDPVSGNAMFGDPTPQDIAVARRRVECSVFAFGGNPNSALAVQPPSQASSDKSSIFRGKDGPDKQDSATVTPSSTTSPSGARVQSPQKTKYEADLSSRYYENESRLSWEFEENPPIEIHPEEEPEPDKPDSAMSSSRMNGDSHGHDSSKSDGGDDGSTGRSGGDHDQAGKRVSSSSPQPKMRYRCKLCGQPKQNHTCPYQQSLARSIGIMVFPAVNAFTAAEPGIIAPALSDMNNFIDVQKEASSSEASPSRPTPDRMRRLASGAVGTTTQVTPESMRSSPRPVQSPSSFAANAQTPNRRNGLVRHSMTQATRKRTYSHLSPSEEQADLLFMDTMELKSEQFRMVTPSKVLKAADAFTYAALPLPYAQRKRLSDNLFSLSNEVPKLTDECAQVLREARERDMWDLAVAELMTQVVVIIHCPEGDHRFEGLRQYLLTLGIAC